MKSFFKNMGTFSGVLLAINLLGVLVMTFTVAFYSVNGAVLTIAALIMSIVLHLILLGISRIGLKVYEDEMDEPKPSDWWNPDQDEDAKTAHEGPEENAIISIKEFKDQFNMTLGHFFNLKYEEKGASIVAQIESGVSLEIHPAENSNYVKKIVLRSEKKFEVFYACRIYNILCPKATTDAESFIEGLVSLKTFPAQTVSENIRCTFDKTDGKSVFSAEYVL